jgi:hypothetical protein
LQAAAPGSYFASRAQLVGAILTLNTSSNPALTVVTDMPQLIALVRELSARDPDSILLLNVLGNYLLLYETLSRAQAPSGGAPVQARSVGDMREAIATFEALADRGRLSPSELLTLANFYGVAHQVGVTPDAGAPPYLERRDRLVEQVAAQAAPDAEIQETIRHSRETWSRTGLYFEQGRREQEARQTSTKVHRAEKLNITNPKARVPPAAAGLRARA